MRVCYLGRRSSRRKPAPDGADDVLELLWNNWNDFGYETTFEVTCRIGGEIVDLPAIRLLIVDEDSSREVLDRIRQSGWDGAFPVPGLDYVSVPSEITFFQQLKAHLGVEGAIRVAQELRDASFLVHNADGNALALVDTEGFRRSLQRERGSVASFLDGWKVLENQTIAVQNLDFSFQDVFHKTSTFTLNFASESLLPHDINVLIGPNGVGKSRVLHQMVEAWINPFGAGFGFSEQPNLSQLVVVSYSPFEHFPVDMGGLAVQDRDAYRYFGFRGRVIDDTGDAPAGVQLSHDFPKIDASRSLALCVMDDQRYKAITDWAKKVRTMERVLRTAFDFDFAAVEIMQGAQVDALYLELDDAEASLIEIDDHRYFPISSHNASHLNVDRLLGAYVALSGVSFFKNNHPVELSSGQRLFAYVVINLLGAIRRNSLVLIDEPELFLHPTLEIQFLEMLKEVLANFSSKALMSTHSEVIVREIPADSVHVFHRTSERLVISHPPFQTFGGDIQRISSYVFGDNAISKPFEKWVSERFKEFGSAEALVAALGDTLNEEMLVQIWAMGEAASGDEPSDA